MDVRFKGRDEHGRMVFEPAEPEAFSKVTAEPIPKTLWVFDESPTVQLWEIPDVWAAVSINLGAPVNSEAFFKGMAESLGVPARAFCCESSPPDEPTIVEAK